MPIYGLGMVNPIASLLTCTSKLTIWLKFSRLGWWFQSTSVSHFSGIWVCLKMITNHNQFSRETGILDRAGTLGYPTMYCTNTIVIMTIIIYIYICIYIYTVHMFKGGAGPSGNGLWHGVFAQYVISIRIGYQEKNAYYNIPFYRGIVDPSPLLFLT